MSTINTSEMPTETLTLDPLTRELIAQAHAHRRAGRAAGYDRVHEWGAAPEGEYERANEWARIDMAYRTLIGTYVTNQLLTEAERKATR